MQQLNLNGITKEQIAIRFLQEHEPPEGYFLGFSGGKDSCVLYDLTKKAGVKFQAYYSATQIDPPELVRFIHQNFHDVIWLFPRCSFFDGIVYQGAPRNTYRWCCNDLKKYPSRLTAIPLRRRLMGIRAEESATRAHRPQIEKVGKVTHLKPIFYWLEWEVWDYIEYHNLPYCSLYDEEFDRLGCVMCPFICGPNQYRIERNKKRWPRHYTAFEKAMKQLWDVREGKRQIEKGYSKTFEEFLSNWYHGK